MQTLDVKAIYYMDDSLISPGEDERFVYQMNSPFIQVLYKGQIRELINITVVRSMDINPPPRKCKWCSAATSTTPCEKCGK